MPQPPPMTPSGSELRRVRSLIADLDAVVWEADARSMLFTFVSEGARDILGIAPSDWLAEPSFWADHIHPDDRDRVVAAFVEAATRGGRLDQEYRFIGADGTPVWVRDLGHVVKDVDGEPTLVRGLMTDITKRKLLEDERREADDRFRRVVERLPAIVYIEGVGRDPDSPGTMLYVSPQVESILGFTPQDWLEDASSWARQFHPDDRGRIREAFRRAEETGEPFRAEYRMFARDGREVQFRDEAVLVQGEDERPLFWQGVMYDVTDLRLGQERTEEAERRARTLIEHLPVIVYSESASGDELGAVYINPRPEELLGVTADEWMERGSDMWLDLVHPDDLEMVEAVSDRADRTGEPYQLEYRMVARDGRVLWFHDEAVLVRDEGGAPLEWQGVMLDITEQKRAAGLERTLERERRAGERLREVDEVKNTFIQAVSHDLRTPLAAILGLAVTLEREDLELDEDERRDMATRIAQNARRLDRIVTDMLDLDRLSRGGVALDLRPVDMGSLLRDLVAASDVVRERRIQLDTAPLTIRADMAMIERLVENLLTNTVKHTPDDARIWVRVEIAEGGVLLVVEDDGPGVSEQDRQRIFEAFQQGVSPGSGSGVGVGLALVARFAELHGGRAWVEDRPGGGASFRVFLAEDPAGPDPSPAGDPAAEDGTELLLTEDPNESRSSG